VAGAERTCDLDAVARLLTALLLRVKASLEAANASATRAERYAIAKEEIEEKIWAKGQFISARKSSIYPRGQRDTESVQFTGRTPGKVSSVNVSVKTNSDSGHPHFIPDVFSVGGLVPEKKAVSIQRAI
jgi:hypothetical protein